MVSDSQWANKKVLEIANSHARDPGSASLFNYASMAHNNAFFFEALSPNPKPMPDTLKDQLINSFSSIETLKREMVLTATAMFGPGFVWLVQHKRGGKFSLLTTYLAGSPYPAAHYRRQTVDMNTEDKSVSDAERRASRQTITNSVGAHGPKSTQYQVATGGADITPVLCINTWEHVYIQDYGVGAFGMGGKREYAEKWWGAIDWDIVRSRASSATYLT